MADTGPLVAATDRRDPASELVGALVSELGRDLFVPDPVAVEVDQLLRARVSGESARLFLAALAREQHSVFYMSPGLLARAVDIDVRFADLDLGFADASVMAIAERHDLPILTFDFQHFRATSPERGHWRLVVDESRYRAVVQN